MSPPVSVIIPAYNAAATITQTLASAQAQTHADIEILVVDDGSTDDTPAMVQHLAAADPRIRLIRQANAGVAAARNRGWREAQGDLLAFLDADDLWAPAKIERQVDALAKGGAKAGLAYCWFAMIDGAGRVIYDGYRPRFEGPVLEELLKENFIGNGSAALVRRAAMEDARGFESGLHRAGAQGCEDALFYCRVAARWDFSLVPDHLVGYRQIPGAMSSGLARMMRSQLMVADEMAQAHPALAAVARKGSRRYAAHLAKLCLRENRLGDLAKVWAALARNRFPVALWLAGLALPRLMVREARNRWRRRRRPAGPAAPGRAFS